MVHVLLTEDVAGGGHLDQTSSSAPQTPQDHEVFGVHRGLVMNLHSLIYLVLDQLESWSFLCLFFLSQTTSQDDELSV